jgi:putative nucleotidyltransferase with HDIG domain
MTILRRPILICEENQARRSGLARLLKDLSADITEVSSLAEAIRAALEAKTYRILISGFDGDREASIRILGRLKTGLLPGLMVIGLARTSQPERGLTLLREGVLDHVALPGDPVGLYAAVRSALHAGDLSLRNATLLKTLRKLKLDQVRSARKAQSLEDIYETTVENLMTALDLRDVETFGHSLTVAKYSQVLARLLGIEDRDRLDNIRKGALLHDIGKIAIPDAILHKPGKLTEEEWAKVRLHPSLGHGLIKDIKLVEEIGNIILYHHERFDGTGYPRGLKKEKIPLEARIFALADALDAITAHRPYRKAQDFHTAKKEIVEHSGTQFDPKTVDAFCRLKPEKWERIRHETTSFIPNIEEFAQLIKSVRT